MKTQIWQKLPDYVKRAVEVGEASEFGVYLLDRTPNFHFKGVEFSNKLRYTLKIREPKPHEFTVIIKQPKPLDQYGNLTGESWNDIKERIIKNKGSIRKDPDKLLQESKKYGGFKLLKKANSAYNIRLIELDNILKLAEGIRALDHADKIKSNHMAEALQYGITRVNH